jgi:ribosomal protein L37AE/L43A
MAFDDIPENAEETYSCPACAMGTARLDKETGAWQCDHCEWTADNKNEE